MRSAPTAHLAHPWRIHDLIPDFRLEDVWALPTPGGPDEFPALVNGFAHADPAELPSRLARSLWNFRVKVGGALGWDDSEAGPGGRVPSLRGRLLADLRDGPAGPPFFLPFEPLYLLEHEFAAEIANTTMHGVMHLSWVLDPDGGGPYHGVMAVYVKPNGRLGEAYMATIRPFRHHVVYPPMMRQIATTWQSMRGRTGQPRAELASVADGEVERRQPAGDAVGDEPDV